jgi:uncharacterized protein YodC (DUF2158 family)
MEHKFKVGNVVALKSGGPAMTVSELVEIVGGKIAVNTTWFDPDEKLQNGNFLEDLLVLDEEEEDEHEDDDEELDSDKDE